MARFGRQLGLLIVAGLAGRALAVTPATAQAGNDAEAAYAVAIGKRVDGIVAALNIPDYGNMTRLRATLTQRYRELRDWHEKNDPILKDAGWKAAEEWDVVFNAPESDAVKRGWPVLRDARQRHDAFIRRLAADLSPDKIDVVKDKMTYGKMQVTYNAYLEIVPNLIEEEKAKLRELLWFAREEAMDGGSSEEKSAIFKRHKNRCKAYLISQGHDVNQDYKNWGEAQKRKAATTSRPAGD